MRMPSTYWGRPGSRFQPINTVIHHGQCLHPTCKGVVERRGEMACQGAAALHLLFFLAAACRGATGRRLEGMGELCFNQLQMLGTHNSYHIVPDDPVIELFGSPTAQSILPKSLYLPQGWEYSHLTLAEQLEIGARGIELDVHADPFGGLYSQSAGLRLAGVNGTLPYPELYKPGFKVLHLPDFDYKSSCYLFVDCLASIKNWSDANPSHLPITIYIEAKQSDDVAKGLGAGATAIIESLLSSASVPGPDSLTVSPDINSTLLADLEDEILSVFDRSQIVTPDDVRTDPSVNLTDLLLVDPTSGACPWPALDSMRGKVLFNVILHTPEAFAAYEAVHPNQEGALMWLVADSPDQLGYQAVFYTGADYSIAVGNNFTVPDNASAIVAGMVSEVEGITKKGYIVRARCDVDTIEARANYTHRAEALVQTGAQIVQTDFLTPSDIFPSSYKVSVPGGEPGRCVNTGGAAAEAAVRSRDISCP